MNFEEHLKKYLTDQEINQLLNSQDDEVKHALLLNTEKMSKDDFILLFPNIKAHPLVPNVFLYDENEYPFGKMVYHDLGLYYLFEPCSSIVSYLLHPTKEDLVLDIASAPGGKSIHTSLMMENEGLIISNEIQNARSLILSSNVERMGRKNIVVTNNELDAFSRYQNTFNKIILDAPCSGSGMFRKQESMKLDWTYNKVLNLAELQKDLILKAYDLLAPNGTMVYSTCSFSYEEDEEVISYLLSKTDAKLVPIEDSKYFFKSNSKIGIHLFPYLFPGEGHYVCLITKPDGTIIHQNKKVEDKFKNIHKLLNIQDGYIYQNNDTYYLMNRYFDTKGLHLIRGGVKLGTLEKYGFEYDHALSHVIKDFPNTYDLDEESLGKYLKGEQLSLNIKDGIVLFTYKNIGVGFAKATKNKVNNKYPKGLRRK